MAGGDVSSNGRPRGRAARACTYCRQNAKFPRLAGHAGQSSPASGHAMPGRKTRQLLNVVSTRCAPCPPTRSTASSWIARSRLACADGSRPRGRASGCDHARGADVRKVSTSFVQLRLQLLSVRRRFRTRVSWYAWRRNCGPFLGGGHLWKRLCTTGDDLECPGLRHRRLRNLGEKFADGDGTPSTSGCA